MAYITGSVIDSFGVLPFSLSAGTQLSMSIQNSLPRVSYFGLETVPNSNGFYDSTAPKNLSGSFVLGSGIVDVVYDGYKMVAVVKPGGGTLTYTPAVAIDADTLRTRGTGASLGQADFATLAASSYSKRVTEAGGYVESPSSITAAITATPILKDASFLYIPSGYASGSAFAEISTNDYADLTWSRASSGSRSSSLNIIENVGPGIPRLDYTYGTSPASLMEPQRTNLALQSEAFDNASWTKSNSSITANSTTSPDGNTTADSLIENTASSLHFVSQGNFASGTYTTSVYVKANTRNWVYLTTYDGIADRGAFFNVSTGVVGNVDAGVTASIQSVGNGWYRCIITTTPLALFNASVQLATANGTRVYLGNGTSGLFIWGFQVEVGAYPTTYIPTTSTTATRIADSAVKTGISSLIGQTEGVLFWEGIVMQQTDIVAINRSTVNGIYIYKGAGNLFRTAIYHSSNTILFADTIVRNTNTKIAIAYKSGDSAMFVNGSKIGSTNTTALTFNGALSEIRLNDDFLIATAPQFTNKLAIYNTRLSDNDCIALTTL